VEIDPRLEGIVHKAMQPDPERRYQSVEALRAELDRVRHTPAEIRHARPARVARPKRPLGRKAAVLVAAALLVGLGLGLRVRPLPPAAPPPPRSREDSLRRTTIYLPVSWGWKLEKPAWKNSLGMTFAALPGTSVLVCIHETRKADYAAYAAANSPVDTAWQNASADGDRPVVHVTGDDAQRFCAWLSRKEGVRYRLPTEQEWTTAVAPGMAQPGAEVFPWGQGWPPPNRTELGFRCVIQTPSGAERR
jgi:formylglycine-generating enzyme required for sulfatase activity